MASITEPQTFTTDAPALMTGLAGRWARKELEGLARYLGLELEIIDFSPEPDRNKTIRLTGTAKSIALFISCLG